MNKKAQGISVNVIIIAAIALLVLVILSVIFIGRIGIFSSQVGDCVNKGGLCSPADVPCGAAGMPVETYPTNINWACPNPGEHCCIKVST